MMSFLEHMKGVPARRVAGMVIYPLNEVLLATLVGVLCGADDWDAIELLSREYLPWLKRFLPFKWGFRRLRRFARFFGFCLRKFWKNASPHGCLRCGRWCAGLWWQLMERPCAAPKRQWTEAARCIFYRPTLAKQDLSSATCCRWKKQ